MSILIMNSSRECNVFVNIEGGKKLLIEPLFYETEKYGDVLMIYTHISDGPGGYELDKNSVCTYENFVWPEGYFWTRDECIDASCSNTELDCDQNRFYYKVFYDFMENQGGNIKG